MRPGRPRASARAPERAVRRERRRGGESRAVRRDNPRPDVVGEADDRDRKVVVEDHRVFRCWAARTRRNHWVPSSTWPRNSHAQGEDVNRRAARAGGPRAPPGRRRNVARLRDRPLHRERPARPAPRPRNLERIEAMPRCCPGRGRRNRARLPAAVKRRPGSALALPRRVERELHGLSTRPRKRRQPSAASSARSSSRWCSWPRRRQAIWIRSCAWSPGSTGSTSRGSPR